MHTVSDRARSAPRPAVDQPATQRRLPIQAMLLPPAALLCVGLFVLSLADTNYLYAAFGVTATTIIAAPVLLSPRFDIFSPWSFLLVSTFFGCGLRGIAMSARWPDPDRIEDMLIFGMNPTDMLFPGTLLLLACLLMAVGYFFLGPGLVSKPKKFVALPFDARFRASIILLTTVSFSCAFYYIVLTSDGSAAISAKRSKINDINVSGDTELQQHGVLVHASNLAVYALLLVLMVPWTRHGQRTPFWRFMLCLLFVLGLVVPFYGSQRLPVMWTCIGICAAITYATKRPPLIPLAVLSGMCIGLYLVMAFLREAGEDGLSASDANMPAGEYYASKLVVHRNFFGLSKIANIINSVPGTLPFENGATIAVWAVANVPRSVWPEKPLVHCGPIIGNAVYGNRISGVPPGVVAELYWNFGTIGVLLGAVIFGTTLRGVYEVLGPHTAGDTANILLYVVGPMRLAFDASGNSIGYGLNAMLLNGGTMFAVLLIVGRRSRPVGAVAPVASAGVRRMAA